MAERTFTDEQLDGARRFASLLKGIPEEKQDKVATYIDGVLTGFEIADKQNAEAEKKGG